MKKKELLKRIETLEAAMETAERVFPTPDLDWVTAVDKFKELEAKIGRIEQLERNLTFLVREMDGLRDGLHVFDLRLDNFKKRMTRAERLLKPGTADERVLEVIKDAEKNTG